MKKVLIFTVILAVMILSGCSQISDSNHMNYKTFDELPKELSVKNGIVNFTANVPESGVRKQVYGCTTRINEDVFVLFGWYENYGFSYKKEDFKETKDVLDKMKKQILTTLASFGVDVRSNRAETLVIESEEDMRMNGYDFIKTEAYTKALDKNYKEDKIHMVIYSLLKDGYPMYIVGVDQSKEQNRFDIAEKYTDMVVQTFREYEEKEEKSDFIIG